MIVRRLGDDVVRRPGRDLTDRHDGRVEDVDAARDHQLQRLHDLARDRDRVDRAERLAGMPTGAVHDDLERVRRRHRRPALGGHRSRSGRVEVMCSANAPVTGDGVPSASGGTSSSPSSSMNRAPPSPSSPGWNMNSTRPGDLVAARREQLGGGGQHRRVGVVPAGVHPVVGGRAEVEPGVLVQRQRVHVAPQQHRRPRLAAGEQGGDARRRLVQGEVERQPVERLEHHVAGRGEVVADLGCACSRRRNATVSSCRSRASSRRVSSVMSRWYAADRKCGKPTAVLADRVAIVPPCSVWSSRSSPSSRATRAPRHRAARGAPRARHRRRLRTVRIGLRDIQRTCRRRGGGDRHCCAGERATHVNIDLVTIDGDRGSGQ